MSLPTTVQSHFETSRGYGGSCTAFRDTLTPIGERVPEASWQGTGSWAEHDWQLKRTGAPAEFVIFGSDWRGPEMWQQRHGNTVSGACKCILADDRSLEVLREG